MYKLHEANISLCSDYMRSDLQHYRKAIVMVDQEIAVVCAIFLLIYYSSVSTRQVVLTQLDIDGMEHRFTLLR